MRNASVLLFFTAILSVSGAAQQAPVRMAVRERSTAPGIFIGPLQVRPLSDGRVLVHDVGRRRVVLFDSTLSSFTTVLDTAAGAAQSYTSERAGLLPFIGDSSIFADASAGVLVVIAPSGRIARVMAPPVQNMISGMTAASCACDVDARGRFYYYARRNPNRTPVLPDPPMDGANKPFITHVYDDSGVVLRADFELRRVDTIAKLHVPELKTGMISARPRSLQTFTVFNPLPITDEWTLTPDGVLAIVRGQDYHIDWIDAQGRMTSSPKTPFSWKRITLEEKQQLIDSVRKAAADRAARNPPPRAVPVPPFITVEPEEIGDYYPAVRSRQFKSDREGNVWILPSTVEGAGGGLTWDLVDRTGALIERVKLPDGRNIMAFGTRGIVYALYAPDPKSIVIEQLRVTGR